MFPKVRVCCESRAFKIFDGLHVVEGKVEVRQLLQSRDVLNPRNEVALEVENLETTAPPVKVLYPGKIESLSLPHSRSTCLSLSLSLSLTHPPTHLSISC